MGKRAKTLRSAGMAGVMFVWAALAATATLGQGLSPGADAHGAATAASTRASLSSLVPPRRRGQSTLSAPSQEEMRRVTEPRPGLIIARHEAHYAVSDDEGHLLLLRPDGVKVKDPQAWPAIDRTTRWDGRALVTEVRLSNGARVIQTYTTDDEGLRLVIKTRVEGGHSLSHQTYKWVYDLAFVPTSR
jgi:hypothetical protein